MNNIDVEHNRRADFGTFVNLLQFSPDYASSIAVAIGLVKDVAVTPPGVDANAKSDASYELRSDVVGKFANSTHTVPLNCFLPLKNISQFFRQLNFQ